MDENFFVLAESCANKLEDWINYEKEICFPIILNIDIKVNKFIFVEIFTLTR